ncbi:MAG: hypothetical protein F6J89_26205 [Symploca sp. SIO1C4]|uniref:Uncharacterized protein n=1 Tax=Symploca sp. SIO1C4 TaxID=2607765 RepID=A0A6B3NJI5_9CYAN|nr:hypothetical protein [Symploca sp. SIO1C4]
MLKKMKGGIVLSVGYMLSPLSWWNDLFFNLPIAYFFGYCASLIYQDLLVTFTILGYWISNILGILMMQIGATEIFFDNSVRNLKKDLLIGLGSSTIYTLVILGLVYFHILELPGFGFI